MRTITIIHLFLLDIFRIKKPYSSINSEQRYYIGFPILYREPYIKSLLRVKQQKTGNIFKSCNIYLKLERFRKSKFTLSKVKSESESS